MSGIELTVPAVDTGAQARHFTGPSRADVQSQAAAALPAGTTYAYTLVSASGTLLDIGGDKV